MKANNPIFGAIEQGVTDQKATFKGVTNKTLFLLLLTVATAFASMAFGTPNYIFLAVSGVVGTICVIMGRFNPKMAMIAGIIYAICEGLFLGYMSLVFETVFPGIVNISVVATLLIFTTMLFLYKTKIVQATPMLSKVLMTAGLAIMLLFLTSFIFSMFNVAIFSIDNPLYIVFAALLIVYGAFMLVLNFDEAKYYVETGVDKTYEWTAALGLIITLIYIYIQVLRFVAIAMARRD